MAPVNEYPRIVGDLIREYAAFEPATGEIDTEVIIDEAKGHYELMCSGWNGPYRVHGSVIHIDIRDGKVWLQYDGTDADIADELINRGIPKDRIVLAFHPPEVRKHSGFAIA